MAELRAIGVDPGLSKSGYAVIEVLDKTWAAREWSSFSTDPKASTSKRLQQIYSNFEKLLRKWNAQIVVIEDVYVLPKYPKAALQLGAVRGVLMLAAATENMVVLELKPTEVKMALTGNGRAGKQQVERTVRKILRVEEKIESDHASDALALALVGLSRSGSFRW